MSDPRREIRRANARKLGWDHAQGRIDTICGHCFCWHAVRSEYYSPKICWQAWQDPPYLFQQVEQLRYHDAYLTYDDVCCNCLHHESYHVGDRCIVQPGWIKLRG